MRLLRMSGRGLLVQVVGGAALDVAHTYHLGGYAHGGGVGRQILQDHAAGAYTDVVADVDGAQHLSTGAHQHVVAQRGVALAGILAGAAQRHAVVDGAVVADLGGFAEDDAHAVVDEQLVADFGAGGESRCRSNGGRPG